MYVLKDYKAWYKLYISYAEKNKAIICHWIVSFCLVSWQKQIPVLTFHLLDPT